MCPLFITTFICVHATIHQRHIHEHKPLEPPFIPTVTRVSNSNRSLCAALKRWRVARQTLIDRTDPSMDSPGRGVTMVISRVASREIHTLDPPSRRDHGGRTETPHPLHPLGMEQLPDNRGPHGPTSPRPSHGLPSWLACRPISHHGPCAPLAGRLHDGFHWRSDGDEIPRWNVHDHGCTR